VNATASLTQTAVAFLPVVAFLVNLLHRALITGSSIKRLILSTVCETALITTLAVAFGEGKACATATCTRGRCRVVMREAAVLTFASAVTEVVALSGCRSLGRGGSTLSGRAV